MTKNRGSWVVGVSLSPLMLHRFATAQKLGRGVRGVDHANRPVYTFRTYIVSEVLSKFD